MAIDLNDNHCENCGKRAYKHCVVCMRTVCSGCIHYGDTGEMCGLCLDREDAYKRWRKTKTAIPFDEWYDANA